MFMIDFLLGIVATIARASRSYSIGLRNSDIEVGYFLILEAQFFNL